MKKGLWTSDKFDRRLTTLFEQMPGRENELQARVEWALGGLLDGSITEAPLHHLVEDTCCVPLIEGWVIVFSPNYSVPLELADGTLAMDFSDATHFDIFTIEKD